MSRAAPDISVVVPTWRRPLLLDRCLQSLCSQTLPPDRYEIVVADDGPDGETRAVVERWAARCGGLPALRYLPVVGTQGPAAARNRGWERAAGHIIAFTDDDTVADPGWLRAGLLGLHPGEVAASGRTIVPLPPRPTDQQRDAAGLARSEFITANCFVRRQALRDIGGFDERFTSAWREDSDLQFRLMARGRIGHVAAAIMQHPLRESRWIDGLRQHRKMQFDALLYKKHPRLYRQRIRRRARWDYYLITMTLLTAVVALLLGHRELAATAASLWLLLSIVLLRKRLKGLRPSPAEWSGLALSTLAIPPLATWWRFYGALRYRVLFL